MDYSAIFLFSTSTSIGTTPTFSQTIPPARFEMRAISSTSSVAVSNNEATLMTVSPAP